MSYGERDTGVPGAVLWRSDVEVASGQRILPDGCLDLIWNGRTLIVAGPDSSARLHDATPGDHYVGLRFAGGLGPELLGMPADELVDRVPDLDQLGNAAAARRLAERVAPDPESALLAWLHERVGEVRLDPFGPRLLALAAAGASVAAMAERFGTTPRQVHRRCLPVFGYGPRRLARVLRLTRALDLARTGVALATVAVDCGYADQAHLSREVRALAGTTLTVLTRGSDS